MSYQLPLDQPPLTGFSQQAGPPAPQSEDSTQESGSDVQAFATLPHNRRRSSNKMPGLKRAVSSPNMRSLAADDSMAISALDKKRNKLGYHRTAVACGHCRRRKIRCIPASNDKEGRCQNCIRLKKDCQFLPVDQQGTPPGRRPRAGSRVEAGSIDNDEISRPSPRILTSSTLEQIKHANGQINTPPLTDDGSVLHALRSGGPGSLHSESTWATSPPRLTSVDTGYSAEQEYHSRYSGSTHPMYQSHNHSQHSQGSDHAPFDYSSSHFYTSQSPYTSPPLSGPMKTSPQSNTGQFPRQSPRNMDFGWAPQPPLRSMSIANTHELHDMYPMYRPNPFPTGPQRIEGTGELPRTFPQRMGHDVQETAIYHQYPPNPYQQMPVPSTAAWGSNVPAMIGTVPVSTDENYHAGWYHQPAGLPFVREEDDSAHAQQPSNPSQQQFRPNPG